MANPLPNHPQLRGNYAPINFEATCQDLIVEGAIPKGLEGSLYRIGPNPKFVPDQGYHWFFGAGMVHAFHFAGSRVSYVNRWARTPKFEAEQAARGPLPMSFITDPDTGAVVSDRRNGLANTHIVWHGDQLLALEEGSHPFSMAPDTLESLGYGHYAQDLQGAMTAHPKIDPFTGELHGFGYMVKRVTAVFSMKSLTAISIPGSNSPGMSASETASRSPFLCPSQDKGRRAKAGYWQQSLRLSALPLRSWCWTQWHSARGPLLPRGSITGSLLVFTVTGELLLSMAAQRSPYLTPMSLK